MLKKFGCGTCGETFKDRFDLIEHAEGVHDKKTTYLCLVCDESFENEPSFKLHMLRNHKFV